MLLSRSRATTRQLRHSCHQQRSVWQATTLLSTSPSSLLAHLRANPPSTPSPAALLVYSLSKNIPIELIDLVQADLATRASSSLGCLSEVLPSAVADRVAPTIAPAGNDEVYSIALSSFHPTSSSTAIPFRSTLTGRPNISLGREIKPDDGTSETDDSAFEAFLSGKQWGFGEGPSEGKSMSIEALKDVPQEDVEQILGLVGSSTPFHSKTHDPFTLFYNNEAVSSGAVGVAVVRNGAFGSPIKLDYAGLEPLGQSMEVTSSKGNIVLTLANQNAARLLLNVVQALPSAGEHRDALQRQEEKEKEFYAAVFESDPGATIDLSKARHVSKIMAGDPSRGAMSVETEEEVKMGYYVVFMHRPTSKVVSDLITPTLDSTSFNLLSIPPSYTSPKSTSETKAEGTVVVVDGFIAASENGVQRLGLSAPAPAASTSTDAPEDNMEPPPFPLPNSIQRSKPASSSLSSAAPPSFSFDVPESDPEDGDSDDGEPRRRGGKSGTSLGPPTSTTKIGKRKKVMIEKGYSQLDWGRLQRSGADLRGGVTSLMRITPEELAQHKTKDDCWQAYQGKVYDVTAFLKYHPGGVPEMMRVAGKDGTELFMKTHAWVNVDLMLDGCMIGFLVR
ncbi:hypothetical protein MNV49_007669 [Pseudohyphozyma bogoriensis]|nr:hypothetical protein MNV49_007669 [Pseudohyphozyma bogoriensis]